MGIDALFGLHNLGIVRIFVIFIHLEDYSFLVPVFLQIDDQSLSNLFKLISQILLLFDSKDLITLHPMNKVVQFYPIHHYNVLNSSSLELNF